MRRYLVVLFLIVASCGQSAPSTIVDAGNPCKGWNPDVCFPCCSETKCCCQPSHAGSCYTGVCNPGFDAGC